MKIQWACVPTRTQNIGPNSSLVYRESSYILNIVLLVQVLVSFFFFQSFPCQKKKINAGFFSQFWDSVRLKSNRNVSSLPALPAVAPLATDQSSLLREIMMAHSGQPCSGELWVPYPTEAWLFPPAQKQQTCHGHSEVSLIQPKGGRPSTDGQSICSSLLCLWVPPSPYWHKAT